MKNKINNKNSVKTPIGMSASWNPNQRADNDFYTTDPLAAEKLLELETLSNVWEPACGLGHLAKVFDKAKILSKATDIVYRGYGESTPLDFFSYSGSWDGDIVTNPPYSYGSEFVRKALSLIPDGRKVVLFLKLLFLESKKRRLLFKEYPPKTIYVSSSRINCYHSSNPSQSQPSSAVCYAWYVWEKGFKGDPVIKWFN